MRDQNHFTLLVGETRHYMSAAKPNGFWIMGHSARIGQKIQYNKFVCLNLKTSLKVIPVLILLRLTTTKCKSGLLIALSIFMGLAYGAGLFNEINVFTVIKQDEKSGHKFSSEGIIVVALYLLSIACKWAVFYRIDIMIDFQRRIKLHLRLLFCLQCLLFTVLLFC